MRPAKNRKVAKPNLCKPSLDYPTHSTLDQFLESPHHFAISGSSSFFWYFLLKHQEGLESAATGSGYMTQLAQGIEPGSSGMAVSGFRLFQPHKVSWEVFSIFSKGRNKKIQSEHFRSPGTQGREEVGPKKWEATEPLMPAFFLRALEDGHAAGNGAAASGGAAKSSSPGTRTGCGAPLPAAMR
ncbi:uncharacterized protein LOC143680198 [Tamandua tetradactyla]|uniref:uncharacterized protein LOC143680198 n=1 Tax=Tamandua tetradactyla TaxID=48850 RepID=UPI0040548B10